MPIEIQMPALSPTMEEGTLAKWHVKKGDTVASGDILAEIETDKATMEFEAVDEGTIGKILIAEGSEGVKVNAVIAVLLEDGESADDIGAAAPVAAASAPAAEAAPAVAAAAPVSAAPAAPAKDGTRIFASPLARRIAADKGVDLAALSGSGPHGRIVKADVEAAQPGAKPAAAAAAPAAKPHFYLRRDIHLDALLKFRSQLNKQLEPRDIKLSVNDFIIKACALALQQVPEANAVWAGDRTLQFEKSDVAVAVAIEGGLFTPVLKDAEMKSLSALSAEMKDLAGRARERKLAPHEYVGGSFAISNLGMFGIDNFDAIINPPHAAILAVGAGTKKPIVGADGELAIGTVMFTTLSVDHRVIDGALGANLLNAIKDNLENPMTMLA